MITLRNTDKLRGVSAPSVSRSWLNSQIAFDSSYFDQQGQRLNLLSAGFSPLTRLGSGNSLASRKTMKELKGADGKIPSGMHYQHVKKKIPFIMLITDD